MNKMMTLSPGMWRPMVWTSMMLATMSAALPVPSLAQSPVARGGAGGEEAPTLYALGVLINRNLQDFQLTPEEFERVKSGLTDAFNHRADQVDLSVDTGKVQALRSARMARVVDRRVKDGQEFLEQAAMLTGAGKTASGIVMIPIKAGKGAQPTKDDAVMVRYRGKLIDGTLFDAAQNEPVKFELTAVIPCWIEALPSMRVGEKRRIVCPPNLAYGIRGAPPKIASQSTLDFEVELVAIAPHRASASALAQSATHQAARPAPSQVPLDAQGQTNSDR